MKLQWINAYWISATVCYFYWQTIQVVIKLYSEQCDRKKIILRQNLHFNPYTHKRYCQFFLFWVWREKNCLPINWSILINKRFKWLKVLGSWCWSVEAAMLHSHLEYISLDGHCRQIPIFLYVELPMKHIYREKLHFNINVSLMFKSA